MLHLIERLIPAVIHRVLLRAAHAVRRRWRIFRKVPLRGVSVILTNDAGEVLLVRHSYGAPVWALPGGGLSSQEDPAEGAQREVREELDVELSQPVLLQQMEEIISGSPHTAYVYSAKCKGAPKPDGREVLEARFFAHDALPPDVSALTHRRLALLSSQ
jgi:ADP-ribose pyrophosphatase YjhB (NUDIX family)